MCFPKHLPHELQPAGKAVACNFVSLSEDVEASAEAFSVIMMHVEMTAPPRLLWEMRNNSGVHKWRFISSHPTFQMAALKSKSGKTDLTEWQEQIWKSIINRWRIATTSQANADRLSGYRGENGIPWIPVKEFGFLRKPNPSWAEWRLNWRCLQSEEIPRVDQNTVVYTRKRKPGLRSYSGALRHRGPVWAGGRPAEESWQWDICPTIRTHVTSYGAEEGAPLFPSSSFILERSQWRSTLTFNLSTSFSLRLTCRVRCEVQIWPRGELKDPLVRLQITSYLKMNSSALSLICFFKPAFILILRSFYNFYTVIRAIQPAWIMNV